MINKTRFKIGDVVNIKASTYAAYKDGSQERKLYTDVFKESKTGQIIGIKKIQLGNYEPSSGYQGDPEDYEPAFLSVTGTVFLWKVTLGMMNKPFFTKDEDVEFMYSLPSSFELPLFYQEQPKWDNKWKNDQRNIMKDHPRDSKGRWMRLK